MDYELRQAKQELHETKIELLSVAAASVAVGSILLLRGEDVTIWSIVAAVFVALAGTIAVSALLFIALKRLI